MWVENYWLVIIAVGVVTLLLGWIFQYFLDRNTKNR